MSKPKASPLPHSWLLADWPPNVTPGRANSAKHMVRKHKAELIQCGALCRIGRNLTILGEGYATFLARRLNRVEGYTIAPNRDASAKASSTPAATEPTTT